MSDKIAELVKGVTKGTTVAKIVKSDAKEKTKAVKAAVAKVEKAKVAKKVHAKSKFGHWVDSVRGRLDELLSVGGTVQEIAEKAGVTVARVHQHIGDLRAQERGVWGPKVQVVSADGKVKVNLPV